MAKEACAMNSFNVLDVTFKLGDLVQFVYPHEDFGSSDGVYSIAKIYKDDKLGICCNVKKDDGTECKVVVEITKLRHVAVKKTLQKNILNSNLDTCDKELVVIKDLLCVMKICDKVDTFERFVKFYRIRAKYAVEQSEIDSYTFKVAELISTIRTFKNKMVELCENEFLETIKTY